MTAGDQERLARSYFETLLNRGNVSTIGEHVSADISFHYPLGDLVGRDAVATYLRAVRAAFPDIRFEIADTVDDGEQVAIRWILTGTQSGPFRGGPPTGRAVEVPGMTLFRFADGRIAEMWIHFDPARLVG